MSTMRASRKPSRSKIVRAAVTRAVWVARPRAVFAPVGASGVERELLRAGLLNVTQHATPRERRRTQSSDRGDARRRTVDDGPLRMSIVLAAGIVAGTAVLAIAAMLLVRRRAPEGSYFEDGDRAAGVFGVLATGFMMGSVAVVITSTLLLLWFLDNQYTSGEGGLRPFAMQRTVERLTNDTAID